jgi:hypothetical protein
MPAVKKATNERDHGNAVVSSKVKSYANEPYFVKKTEEAKATIGKVGLPKTGN